MQIIKPYGRSHVDSDTVQNRQRVLLRDGKISQKGDITPFATSHSELVIAQWISAIDKIATKPSGKNGPTERQKHLRTVLGKAAWDHVRDQNLLPDKDRDRLKAIWDWKIAPWDKEANYQPRKDRQGKTLPEPEPTGRWYKTFADEMAPGEITEQQAKDIAAKIYKHLYEGEYRIKRDEGQCQIKSQKPQRKTGLIERRAQSIARNFLKKTDPLIIDNPDNGWSSTDHNRDKTTYKAAGDIAAIIYKKVAKFQDDKKKSFQEKEKRTKTFRLPRPIAAEELYNHYGKLFPGQKPETVKDDAPGLYNLHMAVRDYYSRIVKGNCKNDHLRILPENMDALFARLRVVRTNRDINTLIRLGKIIHYQAHENGTGVIANWPDPATIDKSRFWSSDGQSDIKRNEAFVRVWRHVIALASRTLTDWTDPDNVANGDIFGGKEIEAAIARLDSPHYRKKCKLLFGSKSPHFTGDEAREKAVLHMALRQTAQLRHTSFHFTEPSHFLKTLTGLAAHPKIDQAELQTATSAIKDLWDDDNKDRIAQLHATLTACQCGDYYEGAQVSKLLSLLADPESGTETLPLPKLRRVLDRHEKAWKGHDNLGLPRLGNRQRMEEKPDEQCRYTVLKLIYNRPFRRWMETRPAPILREWVEKSASRATEEAKSINGKNATAKKLIASRASKLLPNFDFSPQDGQPPVSRFFFDLTRATASEMAVTRGYQSDGENAQDQAKFIGDLQCDVVAQGFAAYLREDGLDFVLRPKYANRPAIPVHDAETDKKPVTGEDWQKVLYFILHLIPVEEIGKLAHQIRKYIVLGSDRKTNRDTTGNSTEKARRETTKQLLRVMTLYLDMHDAKFSGGEHLAGIGDFSRFYDQQGDFDRMFPEPVPGMTDRLPRRGLREIMRFGHLSALQDIFDAHKITHDNVNTWFTNTTAPDGKPASTPIAHHQKTREELHDRATRSPKKFSTHDLRSYIRALRGVITHRHNAAHVTLTNHVRLHRLMMTVLGRLVDFSGLWERDLYFVLLALMHHRGLKPDEVFKSGGLTKLAEGQVIAALDKQNPQNTASFQKELETFFNLAKPVSCAMPNVQPETIRGLRNHFAHLNMLRNNGAKPDLTAATNDARTLMAYDRKLKNAVSQSIIELLAREGLVLNWQMGDDHKLHGANLFARQAEHFKKGKTQIRKKTGNGNDERFKILENLHGNDFGAMVATLFGGKTVPAQDITGWRNPDTLFIK
ncbi:type VI-A CRISPR-associated RNA-guided ribonuclease Cas13a [Thalassospira sp.]|uniref:type VI-A CRISPR-associated RNA-guided ribonuclease Cas13a n=1 Tax=Thalassospira sp. TaxID=1912094 RepID=UPI0027367C96|nr:type VI-A CRISPR-associated RNA-guided ribonuclease Cas13a [Thalassospira sp.]MDP2700266.1 type VI-A CRISPR-associated RNA-guided ribonuclease Cas13a [Thalassospira sp.]